MQLEKKMSKPLLPQCKVQHHNKDRMAGAICIILGAFFQNIVLMFVRT